MPSRQPTWPPTVFSADTTEQQLLANTLSGAAVNHAARQETLAEQAAAASPPALLTRNTGLDDATWYAGMSMTISDTSKVAGQLAGQITARADTLKSNATRSLLLTSIATLALLLLVLLIPAVLGRPLPKLRPDPAPRHDPLTTTITTSDHRLPAGPGPEGIQHLPDSHMPAGSSQVTP